MPSLHLLVISTHSVHLLLQDPCTSHSTTTYHAAASRKTAINGTTPQGGHVVFCSQSCPQKKPIKNLAPPTSPLLVAPQTSLQLTPEIHPSPFPFLSGLAGTIGPLFQGGVAGGNSYNVARICSEMGWEAGPVTQVRENNHLSHLFEL